MSKYSRTYRPTRSYTTSGVLTQASYLEMEAEQHEMKLRQMGGEVLQLSAKCCYVRFHIGEFKLSYVYNINRSNRYFLERLKPYPLPLKEYENEDDVIEMIRLDLEHFQNAAKSKNITSFIKINQELNRTAKAFEDLFLYYNVETFHTDTILQKLDEIKDEIRKTVDDSERLFDDGEPCSLIQFLETPVKSQKGS